MKKTFYQLAFVLLLSLTAITSNAAIIDNHGSYKEKAAMMSKEQKAARIKEIEGRVHEIMAMDKSTLSKSERSELKHELRDMRKEAKVMNGGVYLSVGAIIIIILLLILIL